MVRLLVVEDNRSNLEAMCRVLATDGHYVIGAESGECALSLAEYSLNFDMVLMDLGLPGIDGLETTTQLRQLGFTGPVVAITAHASHDTPSMAACAGCTALKTKPIKIRDLREIVNSYFI